MTATVPERGPIAPVERERDAIEQVAALLATAADDGVALVGSDGSPVPLPPTVTRTLRQAVAHLARDRAVSVIPVDRVLTTQQAADLLNVSRPYLIRLLEEGRIPFTLVGTHRRVRFEDLMGFKRTWDAEREAGLDQLARLNQELGLYDLNRLAQTYPLPAGDETVDEPSEVGGKPERAAEARRR